MYNKYIITFQSVKVLLQINWTKPTVKKNKKNLFVLKKKTLNFNFHVFEYYFINNGEMFGQFRHIKMYSIKNEFVQEGWKMNQILTNCQKKKVYR